MRYYISFILFSLFALTFTSCNTDDLEKDIDALKDRVQSFEKQVQQLNDEMNIIRIALDGNKTITDFSINGGTYTLTLSSGETVTLTPGVVGGNYPSIEIGENGNWIIGGKDTGWRAEATDGEDSSITPQFKIEANSADAGKKYWWVSYNEGKDWTALASAEGSNTSTNPISKVEVVGDTFKVTFGGEVYSIPIVKGLECAIVAPDGMKDGFWLVAGGGASSFKVKVNIAEGDVVRVKAPVEWNAKLSAYGAGTTEVTVTVTPPVIVSECVIAVEVTHGVNTAVDQIKAKTISDSYWAEYQAGFDILIGGVVINKYDNPDGQLLADGDKISANGVYFIAEGATVDWTSGVSNQIIVSEKKNSFPNLNVAGPKGLLNFGQGGESIYGVLLRGIKLLCTDQNYSFNTAGGTTTRRVVFDHCEIEMAAGKSFTYLSAGGNIRDILIESCKISVPSTTSNINIVNCSKGAYDNITIRNNVFYCNAANKSIPFVLLMGPDKAIEKVNVDNNTILNLLPNHGTTSGYVKVPMQDGWTVKNNLVWYDTDYAKGGETASLMSTWGGETFNSDNFANNKVFADLETSLNWTYFRGDPKQPDFTNGIDLSTGSPFVDGTFVKTEGKYTLKEEYKNIGATIE